MPTSGIRKCQGCGQPVPKPGCYEHASGCPNAKMSKMPPWDGTLAAMIYEEIRQRFDSKRVCGPDDDPELCWDWLALYLRDKLQGLPAAPARSVPLGRPPKKRGGA